MSNPRAINHATDERRRIAETIRQACVEEALAAWEQGGMSGLCVEGRWDLAIDRLRNLDVEQLVAELDREG